MMTICLAIFERILPLNVVANTVIFYVAARIYLWPQLSRLRPQQILIPILLLHSTRHLGMMFLSPWRNLPRVVARVRLSRSLRRFGDSNSCLHRNSVSVAWSRAAKPAVWVFNVFGTVDLLVAIATATIYNAPVAMGPAYWIPAFWVPLLLVTHYITFVLFFVAGTFKDDVYRGLAVDQTLLVFHKRVVRINNTTSVRPVVRKQ